MKLQVIMTTVLMIFTSISTAFADIYYLSDKNISAKVIHSITSDHHTFVKAVTSGDTIWLFMPKTDIVIGRTYEFYAPSQEHKNYKLPRLKHPINRLLFTMGPVDKNVDHNKLSFKGIKIGSPMPDVIRDLKLMGYHAVNKTGDGSKLAKYEFDDIPIGGLPFRVVFTGDFDSRLSGYVISVSKNASNIKVEWITDQLEYLRSIFIEKHGRPVLCSTPRNVHKYDSFVDCQWEISDYGVGTRYDYEDGVGTVSAGIVSLSRSLRTLHKLESEKKLLEDEMQRDSEHQKEESIKRGASSF